MKVLLVDQIAKVNYKYSFSLANAIQKRGIDVTLAIDLKQEKENCECKRVNLFNTDEKNIGKIQKLLNYLSSYRKILKMVKEEHFDVIHTQWLIFSPVDYYFLKKIKKQGKCKLVVTIHDILPFNQKFYDFTYHKKVYALADRVIVQADNNVKRFAELFPELVGKETMIPHGHFLAYGELVSKEEARKHLGIAENKTVILFFGQIKKVKGVGVLLEAFAKIAKKYPNLQLLIAGSVWKDDFSQYQAIIDANQMQEQVRTDIKYIPDEDVKYYYGAADFCALPYLDVYQSGVVQLTYAHKKPVVATRIGAFKEVIIDGKTGFMCEPNDASDLANAMERALSIPDAYEQMAQAGYDYIEKKFSWDDIAQKVEKLYHAN